MEELIVNGDFEDPGAVPEYFIIVNSYNGWTGNEIEVGTGNRYMTGDSSTNTVIELDGNSGAISVVEQSFTVDDDNKDAVLSFDLSARNEDPTRPIVDDPVLVEVLDSSGTAIFSQIVTPTSIGSLSNFSFDFQFGAAGTYTLRFTEGGPDENHGTLLDNVSLMTTVCFASQTHIATPAGDKKIKDLKVGDPIFVNEGEIANIRWIGTKRLSAAELKANPHLLPIRFKAGSLGPSIPTQDLLVSPQHRILMRSKVSERIFGDYETLVPAKKLTELDGVEVVKSCEEIEYVHFALDRHSIIYAEGAPSESLFLGAQALASLSQEAQRDLYTLFPDLLSDKNGPIAAKPINARNADIEKLCFRLMKNNRPAVETLH